MYAQDKKIRASAQLEIGTSNAPTASVSGGRHLHVETGRKDRDDPFCLDHYPIQTH